MTDEPSTGDDAPQPGGYPPATNPPGSVPPPPPPAGGYYPPPGATTPPPGSYPPPGGYPQQTGYGFQQPGSGSPGYAYGSPGYGAGPTPQLANYGARLGGWLIDWVIFFVIFFAIGLATGGLKSQHVANSTSTSHLHINVALEVVNVVVVILYGTFLCGGPRGQTIGMMATKVRCVNAADASAPIGYGKAAGRALVEYLFAVVFFIPWVLDMLWPIWDRQNQTLHDKVVSVVVVKT